MSSVWAVARNTLRQALRMKIAVVFIVLLIALLPLMGASMTGDGTLKGRLQTFVSYGLSITSILLCLLTLVVSVYSLTSDVKQRQIYTVVTKPIRRFQLLLGKVLGVILLDAGLLALFAAIIYGITIYMPKFYDVTEEELARVNNEFYTARASLVPAEADVTQEVLDSYDKLEKNRQLPEGVPRSEIMARLTEDHKRWKRAAVPGQELVWEFANVEPIDPNGSLFIRFKYDVSVDPPDSHVHSQWFAGDDRQIKYGMNTDARLYRTPVRRDPVRTFREMEVPANAVAEDGYLAVRFFNVPLNSTVVILPLEDGLQILYKADTFTANFVRAVLLILFRLVFLACLGVLSSTFLSFPVAILFCLVTFFTATFNGFVLESFDLLSENLSGVYSYTIRPVIRLLPQFDKSNPTKFLIEARLLSWFLLAKVIGLMVCIKGFLLLLVALLIFSYREIAKVTV